MKASNDNIVAGSLVARREGRAMPASTAISGFAPLRTARLVLRPVEAADADAVFTRFSHWSIVQWLSSPPWPNRREDTAAFIARCADGQAAGLDVTLAIALAGDVIGVIDWRQFPASDLQSGPGPRVGYWLAEEFWGRGLMSEAAGALCDHIFAVTDEPTIYSGAFAGNAPSLRVQAKLGFEVAGETTLFSRPQQKDLPHVNTVLTRAARAAVRDRVTVQKPAAPFSSAIQSFAGEIRTPRLVLRCVEEGDAAVLYSNFARWPVVQWLARPSWPSEPLAKYETFLASRSLRQAEGAELFLVITVEGMPVGAIDWRQWAASDVQAKAGPNIGYWLAEEFGGRGLMSEAAGALCDHIFAVTDEPTIYSGAFAGNAPSLRVQAKLGFEVAGETTLFSRPQQKDLPHVNTVLTRAARTAVLAGAPKVKR